jgi:IS4 transposase
MGLLAKRVGKFLFIGSAISMSTRPNDSHYWRTILCLPPLTITQVYKCRWQVELFYQWIKQHLRIKSFYETSENAAKTRIWIAVSVYVFVAIIKKELKLDRSLNEILQIFSITLFERSPIFKVLSDFYADTKKIDFYNQLPLCRISLFVAK